MAADTVQIDGIAYVLRDGIAYRIDTPAEQAPETPAVASPFAVAGVATGKNGRPVTDNRPAIIRDAANSAPDGKAQQWAREAARVHRVPGFACTESVDVGGVSVAAHGFAWAAESGTKCKGNGCKGTVL